MTTKTIISLVTVVTALTFLSFIPAPSAKYKVDVKQSSLLWTGKKVTGQHNGAIQLGSGELLVENKAVRGGTFEIDVKSITVTDITDPASNQKLVTHLKNDDFFGVEKYPTASFSILSVTPKSGNEYTIKGNLTIKGKTNEIEFPATITQNGKSIVATAKLNVDRTKYDIRFGSKTFFDNLGDKYIYDDFELELKLVATSNEGA